MTDARTQPNGAERKADADEMAKNGLAFARYEAMVAGNGESIFLRTCKRIGTFKLDPLQPIELILSQKIFNLFTFILGGQFLLPQRANYGKREFFQVQNWMRQRDLGAWGIQTGPFAALCTSHILKLFYLFHLHTGEANSYYPRRLIMGKGNSSNFKIG